MLNTLSLYFIIFTGACSGRLFENRATSGKKEVIAEDQSKDAVTSPAIDRADEPVSVSAAFLVQDVRASAGHPGELEVFIRIEDAQQKKLTTIAVTQVTIGEGVNAVHPELIAQSRDSVYSARYHVDAAHAKVRVATVHIVDRRGG